MSGEVLLARDGDIATVTLSNPGRMNALDLAMWERLGLLAKELQNDESLRCLVVRGAGEKAFAAGADIAAFATERANSRQAKEYGQRIAAAMHSFAACRHPVVALIQGACVGGGLLVASQCDLRICNESARFGVPVKNLGLVEAYDELRGMMNAGGAQPGNLEVALAEEAAQHFIGVLTEQRRREPVLDARVREAHGARDPRQLSRGIRIELEH